MTLRKDNKTGYTGVSLMRKRQVYVAYLYHNGKRYHCGYCLNAWGAAKMRDKFIIKHNFPHTLQVS